MEGTEAQVRDVIKYLLERVRTLENEIKKLRASELSLRRYLEAQLADYEESEKEAQTIRDLLYSDPAKEIDEDGK